MTSLEGCDYLVSGRWYPGQQVRWWSASDRQNTWVTSRPGTQRARLRRCPCPADPSFTSWRREPGGAPYPLAV